MMNNTRINQSLNWIAERAEYTISGNGGALLPIINGAIGGCISGVGFQKGAFQGVIDSFLISWILPPFDNYIDENKGDENNKIHPKTVNFLKTISAIINIGVPILVTYYYADKILGLLGSITPFRLKRLMVLKPTKEYTFFRGIALDILPALTLTMLLKVYGIQKPLRGKS
jgi:hypothetical protein